MTAQRREKLKTGGVGALLGLAMGALGGVAATVRTYGDDVASMHAAQRQHCSIVNLEKRSMIAVARSAQKRDVAIFEMFSELCAGTGKCRSRTLDVDAIPDFPDEECR